MQTRTEANEDLRARIGAREAESARAADAKSVVKSRREEILRDVTEQLGMGQDLDQVVLPMLYRALAAERMVDASLGFIVTEGSQTMKLGFIKGFPEHVVQKCLTLDFGQAVCGTVAASGRAMHVTNIQQSLDPLADLVRSAGMTAYACQPLMVGERMLGTLAALVPFHPPPEGLTARNRHQHLEAFAIPPPYPRRSMAPPQFTGPRYNEFIQSPKVRVIDENGENLGVMYTREAFEQAQEVGLDLVEISPNSDPPVAKFLDIGRHKYEAQKKANEARKKQKTQEIKEIKMRPNIDDHDYDVKMRKVVEFLEEGDKVKVTMRFRGREMAHGELGMAVLRRVQEQTADIAKVEAHPRMEGRQMLMVIAPK
jgi:translation initiation factor IF-3